MVTDRSNYIKMKIWGIMWDGHDGNCINVKISEKKKKIGNKKIV